MALGHTEKAKRSGSGKFGLRLVLLSALRLLFGDGVVWLLSLLFRFLLSSFVGPFVLLAVADGVTTYRNARRCDGRCEEAPACASALAGACARPCAAATCRARAPAAQSARFLCLLLFLRALQSNEAALWLYERVLAPPTSSAEGCEDRD